MDWDPQYYYQDPYYDPYQGWYQEPYGDPYHDLPPSDTESEKLRKDQERIEALESNRLYLKKVKKQCVKEDFAELQNLQLFLFEVLIESLEVNSDSTLGLMSDDESECYITARVKFLNCPNLEISEKDMMEGTRRESEVRYADYFQSLGEGGIYEPYDHTTAHDLEDRGAEDGGEEVTYTTKWEHAKGKSCLFPMTSIQIIQDLQRYPVLFQIVRCKMAEDMESCEPLGYAQFRLPDEFSLSVLQACKPGVVLPVSNVHRETCELRNVFGVKKGKLEAFVRLSSFGPVILTSFKTTGDDRQYIFKPSPMISNLKEEEEQRLPPNEVLKPIIAEEESTVGITIIKEADIFQKPVLWKKDSLNGGCPSKCDCLLGERFNERLPSFTSKSSVPLPLSSDISLCRDVRPPTARSEIKQFGKPFCDWHNMVSLEIKNSPKNNCGCIDSEYIGQYQTLTKDSPIEPSKVLGLISEELQGHVQQVTPTSRIRPASITKHHRTDDKLTFPPTDPMLMTLPRDWDSKPLTTEQMLRSQPTDHKFKPFDGDVGLKPLHKDLGLKPPSSDHRLHSLPAKLEMKPLPTSIGLKPENRHCGCDCPEIRDALLLKKMFPI